MSSRNIVGIFFAFFLGLLGIPACHAKVTQDQVCFKNQCVVVEVVRKNEERSRGLQFREHLAADAGMLFVFENSQPYSFWMKDTWIPLDMIWLDYARRVVHIESHVPPCPKDPCPTYAPAGSALYVLEVNAGHAARMGIAVGDTLEFCVE